MEINQCELYIHCIHLVYIENTEILNNEKCYKNQSWYILNFSFSKLSYAFVIFKKVFLLNFVYSQICISLIPDSKITFKNILWSTQKIWKKGFRKIVSHDVLLLSYRSYFLSAVRCIQWMMGNAFIHVISYRRM